MSGPFEFSTVVAYWDVDREQGMTLGGVFKLLQEAAIKHADQFGLGTKAMKERGESWVLNRLAAAIHRYPRYEESLRVVTWSAGITGFRGYRELRVYAGPELLVTASTLWLYVNLATKSLTRVPADLAAQFPAGSTTDIFRPELDKLRLKPPAAGAGKVPVSLRYSDFDGNGHLNNTAYFDCLQTALARAGFGPRPGYLEMQFLKEVLPSVDQIEVAMEPGAGGITFGLSGAGELRAQGVAS
jgi:acyl-ACP thioesterase